MEELRRLAFALQMGRDAGDCGFEDLRQPLVGHHRFAHVPGQFRPEGVHIVEQSACLMLLRVQPGQAHQAPSVVPGFNHFRLHADGATVGGGLHVDLGDIEPERVQATHPALEAVHLGVAELLDAGQLCPQALIALLDGVHQPLRVQGGIQHSAGLQVTELAEQVRAGDLQVVGALPSGQGGMHLTGLGVHQVGGELAGVAPEQDVRQGHVPPVETGQVQPGEQRHHGVQQPVDRVQFHARVEQRPVGQGERQVPGQQDRVQGVVIVGLSPENHPYGFNGRHA